MLNEINTTSLTKKRIIDELSATIVELVSRRR
jgi:hypothetical protein